MKSDINIKIANCDIDLPADFEMNFEVNFEVNFVVFPQR